MRTVKWMRGRVSFSSEEKSDFSLCKSRLNLCSGAAVFSAKLCRDSDPPPGADQLLEGPLEELHTFFLDLLWTRSSESTELLERHLEELSWSSEKICRRASAQLRERPLADAVPPAGRTDAYPVSICLYVQLVVLSKA